LGCTTIETSRKVILDNPCVCISVQLSVSVFMFIITVIVAENCSWQSHIDSLSKKNKNKIKKNVLVHFLRRNLSLSVRIFLNI